MRGEDIPTKNLDHRAVENKSQQHKPMMRGSPRGEEITEQPGPRLESKPATNHN